jgi:hypothetical protein
VSAMATPARVADMSEKRRELYRSANGDAWYLSRSASDRVCAERIPNASSGGAVSQVEIGTFLARGPQGPERQALLDLIDSLLDGLRPKRI